MSSVLYLHKAIYQRWQSSGLDGFVKAYWSNDNRSRFITLNDTDAAPGTPFPYCVYKQSATQVVDRMSQAPETIGTPAINRNILLVPWTFQIHAENIVSTEGPMSAKAVVQLVSEQILRYFGGHPEFKAEKFDLAVGCHVQSLVLGSYGGKTSDLTYEWNMQYGMVIDVPVAI